MHPRSAVPEFIPAPEPWRRLAGYGARELVRFAYWLAVALPLAYLLVLPASALEIVDVQAVLGMALVHALAVLLGHRHDPR